MLTSAKIIKIIDEYNILINVGSDDGVTPTTKFKVEVKGKEVIVGEENYGSLDYIKAFLEVKQLFPKMCLCQNSKVVRVPYNGITMSSLLGQNNLVEKIAPLKIDSSEKDSEFNYILDTTLKIGDAVIPY